MKVNLKYSIMAFTALTLGFTSCSNDDENGAMDNSEKDVQIIIKTPSTYAEEATAVGQTPAVNDAHVFFTDGNTITDVGTMTSSEVSSGKTFSGISGRANTVVIIGNATALTSPAASAISAIVANDPASKLNALMFEQSAQTNPTSAVNVHGSASISTSGQAAVTLTPAIARMEIAKVEVNSTAVIPLTSFKLAGIYINNTYTQCGTDYSTLPTTPATILNYDKTSGLWASGYPTRFCDEWASPVAGTLFTPVTSTDKWSYYVMPVVAGNGTTINSIQQTSVPHIILKIEAATAVGYTFPATSYVTISDIELSGTSLTQLEKGKVYSIASIAIGGENLTATPETPASQSVSVTATVTPWINEPVTPVL